MLAEGLPPGKLQLNVVASAAFEKNVTASLTFAGFGAAWGLAVAAAFTLTCTL